MFRRVTSSTSATTILVYRLITHSFLTRLQVNDTVNGNLTYTYDSFNRLSTAVPSGKGVGCSYAYDRFGNRWQQNPYAGGTCYSVQQTYTMNNGGNNNNRMDGASYDAVGNLLHDPSTGANYTYDAEGRLITAGAYSYIYDAEGRRVAKLSSGTITNEYLFDSSGAQQIELDGSGNVLHTNVFAGGKLLATYQGGQTYFHFSDWLGNRRAEINTQGQTTLTCANFPFGDGLNCTGSMDPTEHHFTGKERDSETGSDYFRARYMSSSMGRFMTPDWSAKPIPTPYADLFDPQSLNLYSYVQNNPLNRVDPDGHE
jgi:RHS repeat-associated protein